MARGIDAASHKGAMYALEQNGPTVAVLGTGADIVYPAENFSLYEQIAAQGAVISEFPLGTEAQSGNFPRRNRIVSALADAVLVVEAGIHSGSLITARLALEQGRDVLRCPVRRSKPAPQVPTNLSATALFWPRAPKISSTA